MHYLADRAATNVPASAAGKGATNAILFTAGRVASLRLIERNDVVLCGGKNRSDQCNALTGNAIERKQGVFFPLTVQKRLIHA